MKSGKEEPRLQRYSIRCVHSSHLLYCAKITRVNVLQEVSDLQQLTKGLYHPFPWRSGHDGYLKAQDPSQTALMHLAVFTARGIQSNSKQFKALLRWRGRQTRSTDTLYQRTHQQTSLYYIGSVIQTNHKSHLDGCRQTQVSVLRTRPKLQNCCWEGVRLTSCFRCTRVALRRGREEGGAVRDPPHVCLLPPSSCGSLTVVIGQRSARQHSDNQHRRNGDTPTWASLSWDYTSTTHRYELPNDQLTVLRTGRKLEIRTTRGGKAWT